MQQKEWINTESKSLYSVRRGKKLERGWMNRFRIYIIGNHWTEYCDKCQETERGCPWIRTIGQLYFWGKLDWLNNCSDSTLRGVKSIRRQKCNIKYAGSPKTLKKKKKKTTKETKKTVARGTVRLHIYAETTVPRRWTKTTWNSPAMVIVNKIMHSL